MNRASSHRWGVIVACSLPGGAWGAWMGFRGSLQIQLNPDSFAPLFVLGFYAVIALVGLIAGAALCAFIGGLVERLLRNFSAGIVAILCVATMLNVLALWQIDEFVQSNYPGLSTRKIVNQQSRQPPVEPVPADKGTYRNLCLGPPPTDAVERELWEAECR
jgi:hypothetical protein